LIIYPIPITHSRGRSGKGNGINNSSDVNHYCKAYQSDRISGNKKDLKDRKKRLDIVIICDRMMIEISKQIKEGGQDAH